MTATLLQRMAEAHNDIIVNDGVNGHVLSMGRHLGPPGRFGMVLGISDTWTSTKTRSDTQQLLYIPLFTPIIEYTLQTLEV